MKFINRDFFDEIHNRWGSDAIKFNLRHVNNSARDVIPMWIADMDFKVPPAVEAALVDRAKHGIFGYGDAEEDYDDAVVGWYRRRHSWEIDPKSIVKVPGVMYAVSVAIRALSNPGDGIMICQPVYFPFANVIKANSRKTVVTELVLKNGRYEIDFEDFEAKIRDNSVKIFILCSPHNPVGRVWTKAELEEIGRICTKYNVYIISDEIHSDFVFTEYPHTPISSISEELAQRTITCTAPTKTFNLAGIQDSNIIIPNDKLRLMFKKECNISGGDELNVMAITALKAAYNEGEEWLDELLSYLRESYDILEKAFPQGEKISLIHPEGTYLAWLDCRSLGVDKLDEYFLEKAEVRLHNGTTFGLGGEGFVRMNIACPQSLLIEAISRIKEAVK